MITPLIILFWTWSSLPEEVEAPETPETRGDLIVIVGDPGTDEFANLFTEWAAKWYRAGVLGNLQCTVIEVGDDETSAEESLQSVRNKLESLSLEDALPLWVVLIGHGTYDGRSAKFNLTGPDLRAGELDAWLGKIDRPIAVVNSSSASGPFIDALSAENRVIVTSTKSGQEINFAHFGGYLADSISDPEADLDKDGQTSLLEAFLIANRRTAEFYESDGRLATEHALLDDNADGKGTRSDAFRGVRQIAEPEEEGTLLDGLRAHQWHLVPGDFDSSLPPEVIAARNELELQVAQLRARKRDMNEREYYAQLERILLQLARLVAEYDNNDSPVEADAK